MEEDLDFLSNKALLDSMLEATHDVVLNSFPGISNLPKARDLATDLQFILDMRDSDMATLKCLVEVGSFDQLMVKEATLKQKLEFRDISDAHSRFRSIILAFIV